MPSATRWSASSAGPTVSTAPTCGHGKISCRRGVSSNGTENWNKPLVLPLSRKLGWPFGDGDSVLSREKAANQSEGQLR